MINNTPTAYVMIPIKLVIISLLLVAPSRNTEQVQAGRHSVGHAQLHIRLTNIYAFLVQNP